MIILSEMCLSEKKTSFVVTDMKKKFYFILVVWLTFKLVKAGSLDARTNSLIRNPLMARPLHRPTELLVCEITPWKRTLLTIYSSNLNGDSTGYRNEKKTKLRAQTFGTHGIPKGCFLITDDRTVFAQFSSPWKKSELNREKSLLLVVAV